MTGQKQTWNTTASLFIAGAMLGCGGSQGTNPGDMSAEQHEVTAGQEQAAAQQHEGQYTPGATAETKTCNKSFCWTSVTNPTQQHQSDATEHRELAEKHRAAAQALRDAEAKSCIGISEEDRDQSPFYHKDDVSSVAKVEKTVQRGNIKAGQLAGGRAVFRAVPGLTAEWMQRLVNCHVARAASVGYDMPEMAYCPLMVKGATAAVSSAGDGFTVEVTSDDLATAQEIWKRMEALKPGQPATP
jgi:hypothetical protein